MTRHFLKTLTLALGLVTLASTSQAQASTLGDPTILPGSTQVGQPAIGSDMWTQAMTQLGLFRVHRDNCDSTSEAFIEVFTDDNAIAFGFCMDKNEHLAGGLQWEAARDTCMSEGKRLPEPGEYKFACNNGTGLSNMTDDWEWSSNFALTWRNSFGGNAPGVISVGSGGGSCTHSAQGWVSNSGGGKDTFVFRCVR